MTKTKIISIITRLDTGGSAELAIAVCHGLNRDRFETLLVYGQSSAPDYDTSGVNSVHVGHLRREISPVHDIIALSAIFRLLLREKPDIVQTNSSKAGFIGRWAAWFYNLYPAFGMNEGKRAKIIHMPHGHVFYGYGFSRAKTALYLTLERITARITDKLIAITEGEKKESMELGIGTPAQWTIIHPSVECSTIDPSRTRDDARHSFGITPETIVVGTVARFEPVKGIIYLIRASALLNESSTAAMRYLLVGDGSQRRLIESTARELGVYDKLIFTGMSRDVPRLMSAMDIFVQPSLNEGMGKTLVQAHSLGLPIVATNVQGIPDIVKDGETGFLVPPANAGQLAEKILKLAADAGLRKKMGKAGKEWVVRTEDGMECFSEERVIALFEKLYESV